MTRHQGRIQDAFLDHVAVLACRSVEAEIALARYNRIEYDAWVSAGVRDDLAQRLFNCALQDVDPDGLIVVVTGEIVDRLNGANESNSATRYDAFFDRGAGCVQCVFDACFLFFHLDFGRSADLDYRNTAGEFRNTLLQLFLVVVR